MNQAKRQSNEDVLFNTETKKLRKSKFDSNDRAVTCIEHLSNEIFYEIFDYLDGFDIFYTFSKLNIRFNHLVNHSSLPIKIYRSSSLNHIADMHYQQFVIDNAHRIISFYIDDGLCTSSFFLLYVYCALFNRLESLVLNSIDCNTCIPLLSDLTILPRLFSLKVHPRDRVINFNEIYNLIFRLPVLKYNKLSASEQLFIDSLPYSTDKFSLIEHLIIDYTCDVYNLLTILSYTPRLTHLTCKYLSSTESIILEMPVNTFNLKYVFLRDCSLDFDQFEILTKKLFYQIEILRFFTTHGNTSYLDADRWERLILRYMPHLQILNFKDSEPVLRRFTLTPYKSKLNRFISSFWIHRKWFLELKICITAFPSTRVVYSIQPLKKQWYELQDDVNIHQITTCSTLAQQKCIDTLFSRLHLSVVEFQLSEGDRTIEEYIHSIVGLIQFTSLHIDLYQFSISILIQCLRLLSNLDSLTITSEFPEETKVLSTEQTNMFHFVSTQNKITKLNIEQMTELDQVHILMDLCPHLRALQVKCRNIIDAEWLIRYVITKQNTNFIPHLSLICIWFSKADDKITNNLQRIIDIEKLIDNYTIKRICDRIYLQWN